MTDDKGGSLRSVALHQRRRRCCRKVTDSVQVYTRHCSVYMYEYKRKERKERSFARSNTKGLTLDFWLYAHLLLLYSYIYWFRMSARHCWPLPHITDALVYALYRTINVYCLDSMYILLWKEKILDICALWAKSTAASAPSKQEMDSVAAWQFGLTPALKGPLQFRTHYTDWHQTTHT